MSGLIVSWMCDHCGWMNDNHFDECSRCKTPYEERDRRRGARRKKKSAPKAPPKA